MRRTHRTRPRPRRALGFVRVREPAVNAAWWLATALAFYGAYRAGRYLAYGPEPSYSATVPHARDVFG